MYNKNFSKEPTLKQKIGQVGEDSASKYLKEKGFQIIERNYLKKWGEIDIVAKRGSKLHFVEVKSVSREISGDVIHETLDGYRAEDNMHPMKARRLSRTIETYLLERDVSDETEWQIDLAVVYIDMDKRISRVNVLEDIVL